VLPTMVLEPPPAYVDFVATHLEPLRVEVAGVVDGPDEIERLYPEVLTDVAVRWRRLQLWQRMRRRSDVTETCLRRALARRSRRLRAEQEQLYPAELDVQVWTVYRPARPVRSSAGARMAGYLRPGPPPSDRTILAEAAVAWWHAYEAHRRHRLVATVVLLIMCAAFIWNLHYYTGPTT
jgi:hypothetical protein